MFGLMPRIRPKLEIALADGRARCDRELMEIICCERRPVQRRLQEMHAEGLVHIAGWAKAGQSYRWRPMYKLGAGEDVPPPPTLTSTQRVHAYRAKLTADDKDFGEARRRQQRRVVKRDPLVAAFFGKG